VITKIVAHFLVVFCLIFFLGCSSSSLIQFNKKDINIDKNLKGKITNFYSYLKNKKLYKMYLLESPSFRYFYPFEKYKAYYKGFKDIKEIKIAKIEKLEPNFNKIYLQIFFSSDLSKPVVYEDRWIKINNKWYHHTFDPFFFPF
jgi:hypothetical protein